MTIQERRDELTQINIFMKLLKHKEILKGSQEKACYITGGKALIHIKWHL